MKDFLHDNLQVLILFIIWIIAGMQSSDLALVLVPLSLLLLKWKGKYTAMIMGLWLILFLSDNRHWELKFAIEVKDYALLLLSGMFFLNSKVFEPKQRLFLPFLPFLIWSFFLVVRNPDPVLSFQKTLSFSLMLIAIPSYFHRELQANARAFLRDICCFGGLLLAAGLVMIFIDRDWVYLVGRYNGFLGNPNGVGIFCTLLMIFVWISLQKFPDLFGKQEKILLYSVIILSVLLSGSRNAIFSILIFLFFARTYRISPWLGLVSVILLGILSQYIGIILPDIIVALGLEKYFRLEHLESGSGRLIAWQYAWIYIQQNFYVGRGFSFEEQLFFNNREYLSMLGHQGGVHSTYLALWLNTGVIGLGLYLYGLFKNFLGAALTNPFALPALFALLFSIAFEAWFQASLNPFTIIALMIITLLQWKENEVSHSPTDHEPAKENENSVSVL